MLRSGTPEASERGCHESVFDGLPRAGAAGLRRRSGDQGGRREVLGQPLVGGRLKQRKREDGRTAPKSPRNMRVPQLDAHADQIRALIAATLDLTLGELKKSH